MLVEMRDICKDYAQGKLTVPVLKNVSLSLDEGEYIAIMGPSGSGKSTLMNIMGMLDVPTSGSYYLAGEEVSKLGDNARAQKRNQSIGFVFQSFQLLPKMTALDNVALPLIYAGVSRKERRERAAQALEAVGLSDRTSFYPTQLSGGQCQRVAIARAMVTGPQLLLADEPTGALDSKAGEQIMEIFAGLHQSGVTLAVITHEQAVADCAQKIYTIRDGRISGGGEGAAW